MKQRPNTVVPFALLAFFASGAADAVRAQDNEVPADARASAERAIAFLLRAQNTNGSWGNDPGSRGDVGNTAIGALALLATGTTPTRGPHARPLQRAIDWLAAETRGYDVRPVAFETHTLLQAKLGENADLYLVSLLYSQMLGMAIDQRDDERLQGELSGMCRRISSLQKPNGEWETSYEPMLTTVSAWLSLKQAHAVGIAIQQASPEKVVDYLWKQCLERETGIFREQKWNRSERFVTQAAALRVFYGSGLERSPEIQRATQVVLRMRFDQDVGGRQGGEEFLGAMFATQALFLAKDASWDAWYPKIVKALLACQNRDGSWTGHHCITGRVFCTATSLITLLTPDRCLPMGER